MKRLMSSMKTCNHKNMQQRMSKFLHTYLLCLFQLHIESASSLCPQYGLLRPTFHQLNPKQKLFKKIRKKIQSKQEEHHTKPQISMAMLRNAKKVTLIEVEKQIIKKSIAKYTN